MYAKCRVHGSGYPTPPGSFILGGWFNTFYGFGFSRIPGNVYFFFWGIPFFEKCILRGLGSRKAHHFWKMEGIDLAKVVIGTPCNAYISENSVMSSEWERCVLDRVCICLHVFVSKKIQKRKLTESSAQNIFGDPRYSQVSPWVSVGFPGKKRSIGLRCRPPHACIHLEKFMYSLALVSGAPHKAYIFRFNTPTNNTFPASLSLSTFFF